MNKQALDARRNNLLHLEEWQSELHNNYLHNNYKLHNLYEGGLFMDYNIYDVESCFSTTRE